MKHDHNPSLALAHRQLTNCRGFSSDRLPVLLGCALAFSTASLRASDVGGTLASNTTWTAESAVHVTNNVIVPTNVTLTIEAGTLVQLASGVSVIAQGGGSISVQGTDTDPVLFRSLDSANNWSRLGADGAQASLVMRHADVEHGQTVVLNQATGLLESCYLHDYHTKDAPTLYNQPILLVEHAPSLIVRACHFKNYYEALLRFSAPLIEDSWFENASGDGIDFDTASPGATIRRCTLQQGPIANVDGVDLGSQSDGVLVEECIIHDFADKGVSIGEQSPNITVRGCVIYNVDMGVAVKDSSQATVINNTIADSAFGLRLYEKTAGQGPGHAVAWNNILWGNTSSVELLNGSTLNATYSDIAGATLYPGDGNLNSGPQFLNDSLGDFRLATNSPCIGSGTNGTTMGAIFPVGSSLQDSDGDGMPDTWEMTYGLDFNNPADAKLDLDGDGLNNLAEFIAGTDPTDPKSVLRLTDIGMAGGANKLQFLAVAGKDYTVQYRTNFEGGTWQKLLDFPAPGTNSVVTVTDTNAAKWPAVFYRLATPALP